MLFKMNEKNFEILEKEELEFFQKSEKHEENLLEVPRIEAVENKPKLKHQDTKKEKQLIKLDILKKLSSGTGLREGLNDIVNGNKGALIVIDNVNATNIFKGGFKVNCKFTSKRLAELAKMDGAIILSDDFKKILYANTLLIPNPELDSIETGTRHQAAERTAKQIQGLVIAVSERRGEITIYYGNSRYVLQHTEDLLRRATETLQILEKQREVFNELLVNLNVLEVTNLVSVSDVCSILQRLEMIKKMADIIHEYIVELGKDGIILRIRMREITKGIEKKQESIIRDYFLKPTKIEQFFDSMNFDELLDLDNIIKILFETSPESRIIPKGHRLLSKTGLDKVEVEDLVKIFKDLDGILNADEKILRRILKDKTDVFKEEINNLREQIMVGKKV